MPPWRPWRSWPATEPAQSGDAEARDAVVPFAIVPELDWHGALLVTGIPG